MPCMDLSVHATILRVAGALYAGIVVEDFFVPSHETWFLPTPINIELRHKYKKMRTDMKSEVICKRSKNYQPVFSFNKGSYF